MPLHNLLLVVEDLMPLTSDMPDVSQPIGGVGQPASQPVGGTNITPTPSDTASTPVPQTAPDSVVDKVRNLLSQGHTIDELRTSKLYHQYGEDLVSQATKPTLGEILDKAAASFKSTSVGQANSALGRGAARGVLSAAAQIPNLPEAMVRAVTTGAAQEAGGPGTVMNAIEPAINRELDAWHKFVGPVTDYLQNQVNKILPENEDTSGDNHPIIDHFIHKGGDVIGNVLGAALMGKISGVVGGKMSARTPTALDFNQNIDRASAVMKPTVDAAYAGLRNLPDIRTTIDPRLQDLVRWPGFDKVADQAEEIMRAKDEVTPYAANAAPSTTTVNASPVTTTTAAPSTIPTSSQGLLPGARDTGLPSTDVGVPQRLLSGAADEPPITAKARIVDTGGDLPVEKYDLIKRYFQRTGIQQAASELGLKPEQAQRIKSLVSNATDAVDAQMPKVSDPENPGQQIGQYELTRRLGQNKILLDDASDMVYKQLGDADQRARDVAKGTLPKDVGALADAIANNNNKGTIPNGIFNVIKSAIGSFRYGTMKPLGFIYNALKNYLGGGGRDDASVIASVVHKAGLDAAEGGQSMMRGGSHVVAQNAASMYQQAQAAGSGTSALLNVLPYATVQHLLPRDSTQAPGQQ